MKIIARLFHNLKRVDVSTQRVLDKYEYDYSYKWGRRIFCDIAVQSEKLYLSEIY